MGKGASSVRFKREESGCNKPSKIQGLHNQVEGIFAGFKRMHDQLDEVNHELEEVIEDEVCKLQEAQKNIELAKGELECNKKLQKKVDEFLV